MVHIDSKGNVVEKKYSIVESVLTFLWAVIAFFLSLFGYSQSNTSPYFHRDQLRRDDHRSSGTGGGSGGSGGSGGARPSEFRRGNDGFRRPIGSLPRSSGVAPPPCAGGGCGGGGCGG